MTDRPQDCDKDWNKDCDGGGDGGWFVYVLLNEKGVTYTGISTDVGRRLGQHNGGMGARFTRGRGPWRVVHQEGPMLHGDALRREWAIKKDARFRHRLKARDGGTMCAVGLC